MIAYLEISPRLTGKTTRLCALARDLLAQGRQVIFVCPPGDVLEIRRALPGAVVLGDGEPLPAFVVDPDSATWFYDEFDWLQNVHVRAGGYYATTAQRLRDPELDTPAVDLLLQLLEANGNRHERHFWPFGLNGLAEFGAATEDRDSYRLMYLGEFLQ
ncbi:hypothetical protein ACEPNE_003003 [Pseudomonas aeruginosa]|uniref:hypothetical protein n=1 Tax=Pseudomonas aeruginosa TaxID=287 RepID=UPI0015F0836E|nr:hypothetical protein [Pseudomonas aeruginosa]MBA5137403.1 hypothetical protein [Pseudomonas aeruginosa]WHV77848.1 hypothetical protein M2I96_03050 [Pseudomonas aeruginosa]HBO8870236.1 hypothetical protein [Pseudomonas aeruginosa]HBO8920611.1 hypothetical protein [Pseudomonas aeruginosa]HBO9028041.1 hypothetical protein [Pseudomonas aeruginosa]